MASQLQWMPDSLYNSTISSVVANFSTFRQDLMIFPDSVHFDVLYKLYQQGRLCQLGIEVCELRVFSKLLRVQDKRHLLHHCFQALKDHEVTVSKHLADSFTQAAAAASRNEQQLHRTIHIGSLLGSFLSDSGWYEDAERVFLSCLQACSNGGGSTARQNGNNNQQFSLSTLNMCTKLLHVRNAHCKFSDAKLSMMMALDIAEKMAASVGANSDGECSTTPSSSLSVAPLYAEIVSFYLSRCLYNLAFTWALKTMRQLDKRKVSTEVLIDVLRQVGKTCMINWRMDQAKLLISQAVSIAREQYGIKHPKYADALLDFGDFLLHVDAVPQAVQCYQSALDIRSSVFGGYNLLVARSHEDLAYATYIMEYSSGKLDNARYHAKRAIDIMDKVLPSEHLMLASARRVKALILEEMALDTDNKQLEKKFLEKSLELHTSALSLSCTHFGENNVQTAKHYGNLGRLYQSLKEFGKAESMHKKAIEIKQRLLGMHDHEVALSVGHLASLYNYDMRMYTEAEALYQRSIQIMRTLFGPAYSGLEYDYRGLIRLYHNIGEFGLAEEYAGLLQRYNQLREDAQSDHESLLASIKQNVLPLAQLLKLFWEQNEKADSENKNNNNNGSDQDDDDARKRSNNDDANSDTDNNNEGRSGGQESGKTKMAEAGPSSSSSGKMAADAVVFKFRRWPQADNELRKALGMPEIL